MESAAWTFEKVSHYIKSSTRLELEMHDIRNIRNRLQSRLKEMQRYEMVRDKLEDETLIKFSETVVSPSPNSVNQMLEQLHFKFVGSGETRTPEQSVLSMLAANLEVILNFLWYPNLFVINII